MEKFIPYEKLSKKQQQEHNKRKRNLWAMNPVTRKTNNPKAYKRIKAWNWEENIPDRALNIAI